MVFQKASKDATYLKMSENDDTSRPGSEEPEKENDVDNGTKSDEEEAYEVDKILKTRTKKGMGREFMVSWKGYPASENSWEPEENLGNARDAIEEFLANEEAKPKGNKRKSRDTKSSTPASTSRKTKFKQEQDESEHDEDQSKDSDGDDEFAPSKKRGRPSKTKTATLTSAKKDGKVSKTAAPIANVSPMMKNRRLNQNLRWLEEDDEDVSDSDESKAAEKEQKKRSTDGAKEQEDDDQKPKEKGASSTPPSIPDINRDEAAEGDAKKSPVSSKLARVSADEKSDGKKEKRKKMNEEPKKEVDSAKLEVVPTPSSRNLKDAIKFLSVVKSKNSGKMVVLAEENGVRKTISYENARAADAESLMQVMHDQLEKINKFVSE